MSTAKGRMLVTGATGFVGSAVARCLLDAGYVVRALVRPSSRLDNLDGLDIDHATGDLRDRDALLRAMHGCRGVFHVAADYRLWTPDPDAMYASNVDGSRHVLEAARQAGIQRIVYTSSVATLGLRDDGAPADEDVPATLDDMIGHYKRSKFLAEQAVCSMAQARDMDVVVVHPAAPVGPRDIRPTPTGRMVLDAARGRMPAYVDTALDIVHVDDVAEGHRLAYEYGARGRHYILGGDNLSLRDILTEVAEITGGRRPWLRVPHGLVLPAAWCAEAWARISKREPLITVDGVRLASKRMVFSHQRAADELGYRPRPARKALADAVQWFSDNGYLSS